MTLQDGHVHFMQCLTGLTKVRDSLALDSALLPMMRAWLGLFTGQPPVHIWLLRKRDIVAGAHCLKNAEGGYDDVSLCAETYATLMAWHRTEHRQYQSLSTQAGVLHLFPLSNNLVYKQATLVVQHPALAVEEVALVAECLGMFHHFSSLIIENERDSLTGLLNRKTFDQAISRLILKQGSGSAVHSQAHFLAIFDIDHFKRINDRYGHVIGDEVLLMLSQLMQQTFRERDLLFRFGGEEFVGLFACAHAHDMQLLLERFTTALSAFVFPQVGQVTLSIGFAEVTADSVPNMVLEHADTALYYAKEHGRNRTCHYDALKSRGLLHDRRPLQGEIELF